MQRIFTLLKQRLFGQSRPSMSSEELRTDFTRRYAHFRNLLTANNNALQAMAELEKVYYGGGSYRMAFVRSKISTILINVYKMISDILAMSDGKYADLETTFEKISNELDKIVARKHDFVQGPLILTLDKVRRSDRDQAGEKMANLGEINALQGIVVPLGFVITASATRHFLTTEHIAEINRLLQVFDSEDLDDLYKTCEEMQKIVMDAPLPPDLEELLHAHFNRLETESHSASRVAMRSSALGEDTAGVSFAGLYSTFLNVEKHEIGDLYKKVIASKYGPRAIAYRRMRGYRHEDIEMCVGCLVMVDALVSGVIYSRDPGEQESEVMRINATAGIARGVVDGTTVTDLFLVGREKPFPVVFSEIRQSQDSGKEQLSGSASLTYSQIRKLAETALQLEIHFGQPQDVEWSYDHQGVLYILQSRPIAATPAGTKEKSRSMQKVAVPGESVEKPLLFGGISASGGIASGEVFLVDSDKDMREFPRGAVLVLRHPLPEWAPLLGRATAVIAENGTEAGHLATVAREFGIPALFSLPGAMSVLTSGQTITVNSSGRAIYQGRREELLRQNVAKRDIMAGSPVQRIVTEALQYITPLNLNDPTSSHFRSNWCETLHDITRFCHEKSVSEMFNYGKEHRFDKGTAKRLVGEVPLEWWVIDLADGFRQGLDSGSKMVRIEDIVSLPMQAIWRGISAFPWEGPPPISARGFGEIIFQSTMRPDLDPSVASNMATKNYFLISKNFCNLSVRLGYHYAMIEAYLSDLLTESYVTFRFKGGAADMRRKAVRARLLADILKRYDFRVELRSDALLARVKKQPVEYLEQRLEILGYLITHSRQLDMVMTQPHAVEQYREKFLKDIEEMLSLKESTIGESVHE
ncbi:PEP/pyruvate-binding domain-containing protein [Desulforhopalus sp. IMCC35007]|uniref:PEP/pyruvate-binding domain-containing protein n=1 Tax=Desulforhopalus sp. IMCC35007 TaxID=2569543 RepID=UPI0010AE54C8|nr:PEP/pyruvate-binding domain-containing protein [Desulforhopalus sp. IMCC35007]TKB08019.1 pyruvate, water dikinase [Desulforhopalus sp. IMCC35007]